MKDKWDIFKEVQKFGFQFVIVGKLFEDDRVDDDFMKELVSSGEDLQNCFAFIEAFDGSLSHNLESPPPGLMKMKSIGLTNPVLEMDIVRNEYFQDIGQMCTILKHRIEWTKENLGIESKIFIGIRDFSEAMIKSKDKMFKLVDFLAKLPEHLIPTGFTVEEATGECLPEEIGAFTAGSLFQKYHT